MPLIQSSSRESVGKNIKIEESAGKPHKQAIAIALDVQRRNHADGGVVGRALDTASSIGREGFDIGGGTPPNTPYYAREEVRGEMQKPYGFVATGVPGRTDRHNVDVAAGSYVLPAEVMSGLGEGNSLAGAKLTEMMFGSGPFGTPLPRGRGGGGPPRAPSGTTLPQLGYKDGGAVEKEPFSNYDHLHFALGGHVHETVPITVAGGEVIMPPWVVAYHPTLGALNPNDKNPSDYKRALKHGHEVLDKWVVDEIKKHKETLASLPGPKK